MPSPTYMIVCFVFTSLKTLLFLYLWSQHIELKILQKSTSPPHFLFASSDSCLLSSVVLHPQIADFCSRKNSLPFHCAQLESMGLLLTVALHQFFIPAVRYELNKVIILHCFEPVTWIQEFWLKFYRLLYFTVITVTVTDFHVTSIQPC